MKKRILALLMAICLIAGMLPTTVFAAEDFEVVLPQGVNVESFGSNTVTDGENYYATLQAAVQAIADANIAGAKLYCKPGTDVGSLQHAPVINTMDIYGNGAYVSGGAERDFDIGNTDPSGGKDIAADMTLTVYRLNGCGAWGAKATEHTVNLAFKDCKNMGKVFLTGTTGTLNILLQDCAFEGVLSEAVYANANGEIQLIRTNFSNLNKAVNLNHKVAGVQTVTITDCNFVNCGKDVAQDQIPVRVLSSVEGGESVLTVSGCTFTGTVEGGADILLPASNGTTKFTVSGTAANVSNEGTMVAVKADETYTNVAPKQVEVDTQDELLAALANGGTVKLIGDIYTTANEEDDVFLYILTGADAVLDLNGHKITPADEDYCILICGDLTITDTSEAGNGSIVAKDQYLSAEYTYVDEHWTDAPVVTINGGIIKNLSVGDETTVVVNGGDVTLYLYQPDYFYEQEEYDNYLKSLTLIGEFEINLPDGYVLGEDGSISAPVSEVEVDTLEELQAALADDTNDLPIVVTAEIKIPAGATVELDLNGKTVNVVYAAGSTTNHIYAFTNNGELTITGNGVINTRGIFNYGKMVLESGTVNAIDGNGGYAVRNYAGATFIMNGGTIATTLEDDHLVNNGGYDATTVRVDAGATFVMNGGTITNISDWTFAIDNAGTTTVNNGVISSVHTTVGNDGNLTINGGSFTCNGLEGITAHVVWADAGETTINGGTFNGKDNYNGFNVDADEDAVVEIKGGTFLPVHSGSLYGEGTIAVSGGTFFDKISADRLADGYKQNEDGEVVKAAAYVAEVNGEQFESLQAAIDAANGATVTLLADIELESGIVVAKGADVTLELNGKTLSYVSKVATTDNMITNWGTLTIKDTAGNGKITASATNPDTSSNPGYANNTITNHGTLNVYSGAIENTTGNTGRACYPIDNNSAVGCNVELNIYGGTISGRGAIRQFTSTTYTNEVNVYGGAITGTSYAIWVQNPGSGNYKAVLNVEGGELSKILLESSTNFEVSISGGKIGTLDYWNKKDTAPTGFVTGGTFGSVADGMLADGYELNEDGEVVKANYVAQIGEQKFESLQAAIDAAGEDETITLLADVKQTDGIIITDKKLTIDLNGKTFTVTEGASTNNRNFKINGASVVTITNGTMVADGQYGSGAYGTVRTEGTANVTLTNLKLYNYRGNGLNVKACTGTTVTMTNVEIFAQYGGGVEAAGGTVELNNVTVDQKGLYTSPWNSMAISVNGGGKAIVNSGTYSTECLTAEEANNQGTSHGSWTIGVCSSGGTLIVNGGTFTNGNFGDNALATYARAVVMADAGANIQINGGTFNALKNIVYKINNTGDAATNPVVTISGGIFSNDPTVIDGYGEVVIADGREVVENADGTYSVAAHTHKYENGYCACGEKDPNTTFVAKVLDKDGNLVKEYTTLVEAVANAKDGETVELQNKQTGAALVINTDITIDFGGNAYTVNAAEDGAAIVIDKDAVVTLKNGTIQPRYAEIALFTNLIINNGALTTENINLVGKNLPTSGATIVNNGTLALNAGTVVNARKTALVATANVTKDASVELAAPNGYEWKDNTTLQVHTHKYENGYCACGAKDPNATFIAKVFDKDGNLVKEYTTLVEAVANAKDGETVELQKKQTGAALVINTNITINFGGNTYTVNANENGAAVVIASGKTVKMTNGMVQIRQSHRAYFDCLVNNNGTLNGDNTLTLKAHNAAAANAVAIKGNAVTGDAIVIEP